MQESRSSVINFLFNSEMMTTLFFDYFPFTELKSFTIPFKGGSIKIKLPQFTNSFCKLSQNVSRRLS